jgi:ABC-type lipoprotein release transport system permease subunit
MIFALAWKNIWRNKRRTLITVAAVTFGVWLGLTSTGLATGSYANLIDASVRMGMGHVSVLAKGYQEAPNLKKRLSGADALAARLRGEPGVLRAVPRTQGAAMFSTATKSVGGLFMAVDPSLEDAQSHLLVKSLSEGEVFKTADAKTAVVGWRLAERLGLKMGRKFVVTLTDVHGQMATGLFHVGGLFRTGADEMDGNAVLLPIGTVGALLGYAPGEATGVAVLLSDRRDSAGAAARFGASLARPDAEVLPWQETQPELAGIMRIDRAFDYLFQFVLGLVIAVGVLNTALMSVMERKREMGVMMAIGLSPWRLFNMVLLESLWQGLLGLLFAAVLCVPWIAFLHIHGLDFSALLPKEGASLGGVLLDPVYHALLYPSQVAVTGGIAQALCVLAGLFPAWKAGRVPPVESIRDL